MHEGSPPPAPPLHRRLPRPHGPLQDGPPLLRPHPRRFTRPDPSGQETNPYLYADGDPINNIDPTGLFDLGGTLAAAGASIAATWPSR
ncbi:RHS repeat-associated core domain-containing protein [Streptomyces massasporeus]|uniref:RHS repeat-associated core domain-containing protein n=1 Tax=Streptomyces massasporeus TaxID=67324 RepID=UPI0037F97F0F